jgi:DNA-binding PadR family transcriptional regulator
MSVRHGLLAILAEESAHGYGLKSRFESGTAGAWPLNVGQVYTTLSRLERDGLVTAEAPDEIARQSWTITRAGREALESWYESPVSDRPLRDELALKVLLAVAADSGAVDRIVRRQRAAAMERLQEYNRHKRSADAEKSLSFMLLLDALALKAEAELKWLDICEERLKRRAKGGRS